MGGMNVGGFTTAAYRRTVIAVAMELTSQCGDRAVSETMRSPA